ncbi:Ig-like domain-containing protein [Butyrivibrio sp. AC2005]|uniref:Ig-like domain-containing protein n=1 Tax=Butyrivibrio sp. AC2005 TaxID=1280672 RepID=UPI0004002054|nr:Ig-like domain-containing protein [Butyrivibrio sp. AC2005]
MFGQPVKSVTIPESEKELTVGETYTITPTIAPANASNNELEYESSYEKVATVDANGKVTAMAAGKAHITVSTTDGSKKTATLAVTVLSKAFKETSRVTSIGITASPGTGYTVRNGQITVTSTGYDAVNIQLQAKVLPVGTNQEVEWNINNPYSYIPVYAPATITEQGLLTVYPRINGDFTVEAIAKDGSGAIGTISIVNQFN